MGGGGVLAFAPSRQNVMTEHGQQPSFRCRFFGDAMDCLFRADFCVDRVK